MARKQSNFSETFRNPPAAYRGKPFWAWNGKLAPDELRRQVRIWPPYELDVTDYLSGKGDELEITVLGNRRNSHGPLHQARRGDSIGPASFTQFERNWQEEYDLVRSGLLKPPAFVIKQ
jgi:hypothetical protein